MSITKAAAAAMYSRLTTIAVAEGLTASDVQPDRPVREDIPCIVYNMQAREASRVLGQAEATGVAIGFEIDIWHTTYTGLRVLQAAVEEGLEGFRGGTATSFGAVFIHSISIDSADDRPLFPMPGEPDGLYRASLTLTMLANN